MGSILFFLRAFVELRVGGNFFLAVVTIVKDVVVLQMDVRCSQGKLSCMLSYFVRGTTDSYREELRYCFDDKKALSSHVFNGVALSSWLQLANLLKVVTCEPNLQILHDCPVIPFGRTRVPYVPKCDTPKPVPFEP